MKIRYSDCEIDVSPGDIVVFIDEALSEKPDEYIIRNLFFEQGVLYAELDDGQKVPFIFLLPKKLIERRRKKDV